MPILIIAIQLLFRGLREWREERRRRQIAPQWLTITSVQTLEPLDGPRPSPSSPRRQSLPRASR